MDEAREARRVAGLELARANLAKPRVVIDRREPPPVDGLTKWRDWPPWPPEPEKRGPTDSQLQRQIAGLREEMRATFDAHREYVQEYVRELLILVVSDINADIDKLRDETAEQATRSAGTTASPSPE